MKRFTRVPFNTATLAGIFRRALKEYDRVHGRVTKRNVVPYIKPELFMDQYSTK